MRVAVFSAKPYDASFLKAANETWGHELVFWEAHLGPATAELARGFPVVCAFVNDNLGAEVVHRLADGGTRMVALRCAGYNQVDLNATGQRGIVVTRVPAYSPHAVAEHTLGLILCLNRKIHRAYNRVREGNFSIDGLLGFDLYGKTVGVVGTGKIGALVANIMAGLGCRVLAHDPRPSPTVVPSAHWVNTDELFSKSDIITLHCPLISTTRHLVGREAIARMKPGVMLINTSRGALIDTPAVIAGLKSGHIGALGLDVYEEEADLFFEDHSNAVMGDDVFARLLTFPNVLITGHQAFFTQEAMEAIARTTLANISAFAQGQPPPDAIDPPPVPA